MRKTSRAVILFLIVAAIVFVAYRVGAVTGHEDGFMEGRKLNIDRSQEIHYPYDEYPWAEKAFISLFVDKYYHIDPSCPFIYPKESANALLVSEYEAITRGYQPCPNCADKSR